MLEPIAARRLGLRPENLRSFGEKINAAPFGIAKDTIEADIYMNTLVLYDAKRAPDLVTSAHINDLEKILIDPVSPIARAVFPTDGRVGPGIQQTIDAANDRIRIAFLGRGQDVQPGFRFIEVVDVGVLQ